jgi:hypothetical protein
MKLASLGPQLPRIVESLTGGDLSSILNMLDPFVKVIAPVLQLYVEIMASISVSTSNPGGNPGPTIGGQQTGGANAGVNGVPNRGNSVGNTGLYTPPKPASEGVTNPY